MYPPSGRSTIAAVILTAVLGLIAPSIASATFHPLKVSEVHPGTAADPDAAFIELQAYQAGQNQVGNHMFRVYSDTAGRFTSFTIMGDVPNAQTQRTVLLADTAAPGGVIADSTHPTLGDAIDPNGGAVCFETIDCVAWGSFTGEGQLPSPTGGPVAPTGIPDGSSVSRSIARGCGTLLEDTDDTNDSASDFSLPAPTPRPNSVSPVETACGGGGGAPDTEIDRGPKRKSSSSKATFRFSSPIAGVGFECQLDRRAYGPCGSPRVFGRVKPGNHAFRVRALLDGMADPSPAEYRWKVTRPKRR